jgi:hypothetical protein
VGLDIVQFKQYVVIPTLTAIGLGGDAAINLIVGTAMAESRLTYLKQLGTGPAISIMEIEPGTYLDMRDRLTRFHPMLYSRVLATLNMQSLPADCNYLIGNLTAAVIFARLKYYFSPAPLPPFDDASKLAQYYKKIYNTSLGAADISVSTNIFKSVILNFTYHG